MANTLSDGIGEKWGSVLQAKLYESFVGMQISNTKFEGDFTGNDTVHFTRLAKITSLDLPTSYSSVTIQDLEETDETFSLDTRKHFAFELSEEDLVELRIDPESDAIKSGSHAFASDWDDSIFAQHANAGYTVDDGDMETATNGGTGNPVKLTKSNIYDLITAITETFDNANVPTEDRWVTFSPAEKRLLSKSDQFLRATNLGDQVVRKGFFGEVDDTKILISNNLVSAGGIKHVLAGQGKPICFASNIKPKVQVTPPQYRDSFTYLVKAQTKFGSKVFTEGSIKLADVEIFTT